MESTVLIWLMNNVIVSFHQIDFIVLKSFTLISLPNLILGQMKTDHLCGKFYLGIISEKILIVIYIIFIRFSLILHIWHLLQIR